MVSSEQAVGRRAMTGGEAVVQALRAHGVELVVGIPGTHRSPSDSCSRVPLNQPMYSTIASSSCERVRQTRSAISSGLKLSTKLSASALS
jgi:hypothetical protein